MNGHMHASAALVVFEKDNLARSVSASSKCSTTWSGSTSRPPAFAFLAVSGLIMNQSQMPKLQLRFMTLSTADDTTPMF